MGGAWQPMTSAPRDGTRIIGWFEDRCIAVFWRCGVAYVPNRYGKRRTNETAWYWSDGYSRYREPDFWQPEPEPPAGFSRAPLWEPKDKRVLEEKPPCTLEERLEGARSTAIQRTWCPQCERKVTAVEAEACSSRFCKAKAEAA
jgi:hypothetical protein